MNDIELQWYCVRIIGILLSLQLGYYGKYFIHPTVVRGFFINAARWIFRVLIWTPNVPGAKY